MFISLIGLNYFSYLIFLFFFSLSVFDLRTASFPPSFQIPELFETYIVCYFSLKTNQFLSQLV